MTQPRAKLDSVRVAQWPLHRLELRTRPGLVQAMRADPRLRRWVFKIYLYLENIASIPDPDVALSVLRREIDGRRGQLYERWAKREIRQDHHLWAELVGWWQNTWKNYVLLVLRSSSSSRYTNAVAMIERTLRQNPRNVLSDDEAPKNTFGMRCCICWSSVYGSTCATLLPGGLEDVTATRLLCGLCKETFEPVS